MNWICVRDYDQADRWPLFCMIIVFYIQNCLLSNKKNSKSWLAKLKSKGDLEMAFINLPWKVKWLVTFAFDFMNVFITTVMKTCI